MDLVERKLLTLRAELRPNPSIEGTSYGLCPPAASHVKR
jgi:hypothetical protein